MADFMIAYKRTAVYEGGYANDPADRGGETWKGIARKMHPNWAGWVIIDTYRDHPQFPSILKRVDVLEWAVHKFYHDSFWMVIKGDKITNQLVANDIYDDAVNTGVSSAIKKAQRVFNLPETGVVTDQFMDKLNNVG